MFESSPIAIPTPYENTKFPSVDEKIKQIQQDRLEALAAHELAKSRIAN